MTKVIQTILICGFLFGPTFSNAWSQTTVDKHFEKIDFAHGLFQRGLFEMAVSEYQQFIDKYPESTHLHEAYFGLGESYFFSKDYMDASGIFQDYIDKFSNHDKINLARIRLGQCLYNDNKFNAALNSVANITDDGLDEEWLQKKYYLLAQIHKALGQDDQAIVNFQKIEQLDKSGKTSLDAMIKLGEAYKAKKNYDAAKKSFEKVISRTKDSKIVSLAQYRLAEIAFLSEEYDQSADIFAKVIELKPDKKMVEDSVSNLLLALFNIPAYNAVISSFTHYQEYLTPEGRLFDSIYVLARSYKQLNMYDKALKHLNKSLGIKNLSQVNRNKAVDVKVETLFLQKNYKAVIDVINKNWKGQKEFQQKALFFLGESHYSQGEFKKAHDYYEKLLNEFPETTYQEDAYYGLAHAKNALGAEQEAAELFQKYFASADDDEKKREALFNQILLRSKVEKYKEVIRSAEKYLADYPKDSKKDMVLFILGTAYSKEQKYKESIKVFEKIVAGDPSNPKKQDSLFLLAYNLQLVGTVDKALGYYDKVQLNSEDPSLYYSARKNMALIYLDQQNFTKASLLIKEIINNYEQNDLAIEMYLWLAERSLEAKSYDNVVRVMEKAARKQKTDQDKQAVAYFKAMALQKLKEYQKALKFYNVVLSVEKDSLYFIQSQVGKVQCLVFLKRYDDAKALLDQVLLNYGDDENISLKVRFEMANLLELQSKLDEAAKFYMLVAVLYSDPYYCPESLFRAGQIFEKNNKENQAINVYQEIIQLYTDSHRFNEAQKRLANLSQ